MSSENAELQRKLSLQKHKYHKQALIRHYSYMKSTFYCPPVNNGPGSSLCKLLIMTRNGTKERSS